MSLVLTGLGLLASGVGAGINAYKNAQSNKMAETYSNKLRGLILTDKYSSPFDNMTTKGFLSQMDRRLKKNNEAVENRAAAGGATFENVLAAKQAGNETMADAMSGLMQAESARQSALNQQLLSLEQQRSAQKIAANQAAGQMWSSLGNNFFDSMSTLGGSMLESGTTLSELFKFK